MPSADHIVEFLSHLYLKRDEVNQPDINDKD